MPSITQPIKAGPSLRTSIQAVMEEAACAQPFRTHSPGGDHERAISIPVSAVRSKIACLSSENLVGLFDKSGRLRRTPRAAPSSDTVRMDAALVANSRVARAGAGIIIMPEPGTLRPVGKTGVIAMETIPAFVRNVEAAEWSTVDVNSEAEVPVSELPIDSVEIDWSTATAKAVRFEVNRRERMRYGDQDGLCDEIIAAITLGLARAADEVLLSALAGHALSPFSLAGAATQGLAFDDLRSLVGTTGTGATVSADGVLRVAGTPAELTADTDTTFIGAWNRAAVAIGDEVAIHFERIGLQGQMTVTAWASMQAAIPDASKFWIAA